uniref:Uncharacterized protein n=1 Tax=Spongospora subterranea TaxID=70186 RepID=A0A0H5RDG9_9EUKA|eukprot:CRZ06599.1 hypothetical protein [Spongospora subterranea]
MSLVSNKMSAFAQRASMHTTSRSKAPSRKSLGDLPNEKSDVPSDVQEMKTSHTTLIRRRRSDHVLMPRKTVARGKESPQLRKRVDISALKIYAIVDSVRANAQTAKKSLYPGRDDGQKSVRSVATVVSNHEECRQISNESERSGHCLQQDGDTNIELTYRTDQLLKLSLSNERGCGFGPELEGEQLGLDVVADADTPSFTNRNISVPDIISDHDRAPDEQVLNLLQPNPSTSLAPLSDNPEILIVGTQPMKLSEKQTAEGSTVSATETTKTRQVPEGVVHNDMQEQIELFEKNCIVLDEAVNHWKGRVQTAEANVSLLKSELNQAESTYELVLRKCSSESKAALRKADKLLKESRRDAARTRTFMIGGYVFLLTVIAALLVAIFQTPVQRCS